MAAGETTTPPFSSVHVNRRLATANRLMAAVHAALAAAAIAHRALHLHQLSGGVARNAAMVAADLTLLFLWTLSQSGLWRPVSRAAFPDRLLESRRRGDLPAVDVLVVTADPDKEPALGVMNTVVSAMALDYHGGRLSVYLSDDAGSPLTLMAARKAYAFARAWVPFCRRHSVQCPWPDRYFAGDDGQDDGGDRCGEAAEERRRMKKMYETFKGDIEEASKEKSISRSWTKEKRQDHDAYVEIITAGEEEDDDQQGEETMPLLVYVSRQKRRASPHHFKAGALNALLRVSSLVSNAPYLLVLDCDMSCNSRSSALEAMCFHLDRSPPAPESLAFVQFPQMFHNLSPNDIYTNDLRSFFATRWIGQDGLRGPLLVGTGFYVRRDALYGAMPSAATSLPAHGAEFSSMEAGELVRRFGHSDDLISSVRNLHLQKPPAAGRHRRRLPRDAALVASCAYETGTGWGDEVGFMYQSVVEDYFTGYRRFFSRGWTSAYCYPAPSSRPPFLGTMPTNLNDVLVQNKRWMSGLLAVGLSRRYCPLTCRGLLAVSVPQAMTVAYFGFLSLYAFPALCYATLPQLCFLRGVPLFPDAAAAPWFAAAFASSLVQHLVEVSVARRGLAVRTWWNEQRFWMLNAVTAQLFGCVSAVQDLVGAAVLRFDLTTKADDDDGGRLYQKGVFDFTGCSTLLLPATTLCALNAAALVGGTWKMMTGGGGGLSGEMLPQLFLLSYVAALSYPLLEGMFLRMDSARVPGRITALSVALAAVLLSLFG
ncbi:hypothetical protein SEVIR_3G346501v4 [Setaria viridis]|uniref:Glycosyltransferase 2-like domain-containing protein n=1 Tax=Setaria viridis TaxID=4556 RepID=A0A4U6VGK4_SETVI|nr:cellulose synthase-like protein G2 [Setaria viridis]TKW28710.1 hypothetical protein SEVIR_3G346501v2 [Setaria viridis]